MSDDLRDALIGGLVTALLALVGFLKVWFDMKRIALENERQTRQSQKNGALLQATKQQVDQVASSQEQGNLLFQEMQHNKKLVQDMTALQLRFDACQDLMKYVLAQPEGARIVQQYQDRRRVQFVPLSAQTGDTTKLHEESEAKS